MSDQSTERYTGIAISLHWLIALGIFCAMGLGVYMADLPLSPTKIQLYTYHKWIGISILLLVILRILWRITHRPPPLPVGMSEKEQRIAHGIAHGMYLFMLIVPLTGWLMSSALGKPVVLFNLLPLPDLISADKQTGELLKGVHEICNYTFATLFSLHILASLKHHFKDRDGTLARMLPFLEKNRR